MNSLKNKIAIVTGASKGIGASIAKTLAHAGATVVVNFSGSKDAATQVVKDIESKGGNAIAIQAGHRRIASTQNILLQFTNERND